MVRLRAGRERMDLLCIQNTSILYSEEVDILFLDLSAKEPLLQS